MDPLLTNGIDPALLRVLEKRGNDREPLPARRRPSSPKTVRQDQDETENSDTPKHELDDLA